MSIKSLATIGIALSALAMTSLAPAEACDGNRGGFRGMRGQGRFNQNGIMANYGGFNPYMNNMYAGVVTDPSLGVNGNLGGANQMQRLQALLASGRLSSKQAQKLQRKMARLQSQQFGFNTNVSGNVLGNFGLNNEQARLQQLISSGMLNQQQLSLAQNRLFQLQGGNPSLVGYNPYINGGVLSGLRGLLGF